MDLCHHFSASLYRCGSPMVSSNLLLPLGWDSAPYGRTYYGIFIATICADLWDDRDIFFTPCPKSPQLWGDVVTCWVRVNMLRLFFTGGWYPLWTSSLVFFSGFHLLYCGRCALTYLSKKGYRSEYRLTAI